MTKSVCLHAALSRPPRENPWTASVDPEDSAFPYRDWTCRAHAQCYGPLAFHPVLGPDRRPRGTRNLYRDLSFSVSPLLLAWLERERPGTYERLREADRDSAARLGQGNALAQPYGDAPLPGLNRRDKTTAVRWGLEDFRRRFGRPAQGLWLPGLQADAETLEVLVEQGVRFTILPAARAGRIRTVAAEAWKEARPETFNPTRPYQWRSPSRPGAGLAVFFPHSLLCGALASGEVLEDGESLRRKVRARFLPDDSTQLVHAAVPAEVFGLEHPRGPAALAAALSRMAEDGLPATNYAAFLDRFPPPQEVELREEPAAEAPAWRAGLRAALRELAAAADELYAGRAADLLEDPWLSRDVYAQRLCRDTPEGRDDFLSRRGRRHLKPEECRQALRLLELQRRRLLMLSEAGHDGAQLGDAEPLQALKNACRACELASAFGRDLAGPMRARLAEIKVSLAGAPADGELLWSRQVAPAAVDWTRAAAHFALLEHLGVGLPPAADPGGPGERFALLRAGGPRRTEMLPAGRDAAWSWLRLSVLDRESRLRHEASVCVHQLERLDTAAWVLPPQEPPADLAGAFAAAAGPEFRARLGAALGEAGFTLEALLGEERLQVLRWLMPDPSGNRKRQDFLAQWAAAVGRLRRGQGRGDELMALLGRCRAEGLLPDQLPWASLARGQAQDALERFLRQGSREERDRALAWLSAAESAGLHVDVPELRSQVLLWQERLGAAADPAERDAARALAEKLGLSEFLPSAAEAPAP